MRLRSRVFLRCYNIAEISSCKSIQGISYVFLLLLLESSSLIYYVFCNTVRAAIFLHNWQACVLPPTLN